MKIPFLGALHRELDQNRSYLEGEAVSTIYFGGGTPSLLSSAEIGDLIHTISKNFTVSPGAEITLEANPDDLTSDYLSHLPETGVNRLSIGVQSFFDEDLRALNRVHDASQVRNALEGIRDAGYRTSVDLIYGIPGLTDDRWQLNLETAVKYGIQHISAYALTVEEKTALHWMIGNKRYPPVSEEQAARQYGIMVKHLKDAGYVHYEISNFCKPGYESKHNSAYWRGVPYLGAGPSAHSFNGVSRKWNVSNISEYVNMINKGMFEYGVEMLTPVQRYNEYVMTGLRTVWGCDEGHILNEFGTACRDRFVQCAARYVEAGRMVTESGRYRLTEEGMLFADGIAADFFLE